MKIIEQSIELLEPIDKRNILKKIELAGRTCYKSENYIKEGSSETFIERIIKSGHESVIEHASISLRIITDRGVTHELVRHRIASYSQESTRYCNYCNDKFGNELTFIRPIFNEENNFEKENFMKIWENSMQNIENAYLEFSKSGISPEYSRSILPNSLKTEIVATLNLRSWRNFLKLRLSKYAHPQIRDIAFKILDLFVSELPNVFEDLIELKN